MAFSFLRQLFGQPSGDSAEPTCGKCGYCVRGISGLICPECGSDLREVGIIPAGGLRSPRFSAAMAWTFALPLPAVLISILLMNTVLPYCQTLKISRDILCQAPYLNLTFDLFGKQAIWQPVLVPHNSAFPENVVLMTQQHGTFLQVNLKSGAYDYYARNGVWIHGANGFSGAIIANWLAGSGVNTADQRARDLCDQVYLAMNEIPQGNAGKSTVFHDHNGLQVGVARPASKWIVHDEPSPIAVGALVLFWIVLWAYGIRRIRQRDRPAKPRAG